jgi:hypothetical protein
LAKAGKPDRAVVLALPRPRDPSHSISVDGLEMDFDS